MTKIPPDILSARAVLQDEIGYQFKNPALLQEALTHSSVTKQYRQAIDNERLEFLGDRVIGLVIADVLFEKTETDKEREGILTRRYADCVENARLCKIAKELKIDSALQVQANFPISKSDKALADALEALIGAIWRDGGIEAAQQVILRIWGEFIADSADFIKDAKTRLQELTQQYNKELPEYTTIDSSGPSHLRLFTVLVSFGDYEIKGQGRSKQQAEQAAAAAWLENFADKLAVR